MKKLLLVAAAASMAVGTWAKTYDEVFPAASTLDDAKFVDVTPTNFHFNKGETNLDQMIRTDLGKNGPHVSEGPHLGGDSKITTSIAKGDGVFTLEGLAAGQMMAGAAINNNSQEASFKNAVRMVDLGGKIGKVVCFNGTESGINDVLVETFGIADPQIPGHNYSANNGYFFFLNHVAAGENMPEGGKLRIRFELNAYHNDLDENEFQLMDGIYLQDEQGNPFGTQQGKVYYSDFTYRVGDANPTAAEYDDTPTDQWNPYRWMVYEFDVNDQKIGEFIKYWDPSTRLANGALFIRNIEVRCASAADADIPANTVRITWNDYTPDPVLTYDDIFPAPQAIDETHFTDVTPSYYKFTAGETDLDAMIHGKVEGFGAFNIGNSLITANTNVEGGLFTTENLKQGHMFNGAYVYNNNLNDAAKEAQTIVDLGGEIGKVLCINGTNSGITDVLNEKLGLELEEVPGFGYGGNFVILWILDHLTQAETLKEGDRLRVRMELNAFHNDLDENEFRLFNNFYVQNEEGNVLGMTSGDNYNAGTNESGYSPVFFSDFTYRVGDTAEDEEFDATPTDEWNPYRWMVYEFEVNDSGVGEYLKFNSGTGGQIANGAFFIRNFEVYVVDGSYDSGMTLGKSYIGWNNYAPETEGPGEGEGDPEPGEDGIVDFSIDNNAPVVLYNLQGVRVDNPAPGIYISRQGNTTTKVIVK